MIDKLELKYQELLKEIQQINKEIDIIYSKHRTTYFLNGSKKLNKLQDKKFKLDNQLQDIKKALIYLSQDNLKEFLKEKYEGIKDYFGEDFLKDVKPIPLKDYINQEINFLKSFEGGV